MNIKTLRQRVYTREMVQGALSECFFMDDVRVLIHY